jgi:hypothetical protein
LLEVYVFLPAIPSPLNKAGLLYQSG